MPDKRGSRTRRRGSSSTWPRASATREARAPFSVSSALPGSGRPRWRSPSPRPWGAGACGCRVAASATTRTCGATTARGTGLNPARSSASSGGSGTETRSSCSTRWTRSDPGPPRCSSRCSNPEQQGRFRDSFVEFPFDLSEILFIATANEWTQIPPPLQDRLEVVHLSGYTEAEKVAIARTHLVPGENKAAGLVPTPVRVTDGALRQIIRDYTSEPGIRQLARRIKTVCRKVALGRETGDRALDRERVTARDVRRWFGTDTGDAEGLDRLRRRLDAPAIPSEVRSKGRDGLRPPVVVRLGVDGSGVQSVPGSTWSALRTFRGTSAPSRRSTWPRCARSWTSTMPASPG